MDTLSIDQQPELALDSEGSVNTGFTEIAQAAPGAESIGRIDVIRGTVEITRADGSKSAVQEGDAIFKGDVIETGGDGSVSMIMADDTVFSLDRDGEVTMDEMVYDPADQSGQMNVSLVKGVFSFVSGGLAKTDPDAMVLNTPVATIGIRGTTGSLDVGNGESLQVVLAPNADGTTGELVISNDSGVQIMNVAFQALQVAGINIPIGQPIVLPAAQVQNLVSAVQNSANKIGNTGGVTRSDSSSNQAPTTEQQGVTDPVDGANDTNNSTLSPASSDDAGGDGGDGGDGAQGNSSDTLGDAIKSFAKSVGVNFGGKGVDMKAVIEAINGENGNGNSNSNGNGNSNSNGKGNGNQDDDLEEQIEDVVEDIVQGKENGNEIGNGNGNGKGNGGNKKKIEEFLKKILNPEEDNSGNGNSNNGNDGNNTVNAVDGTGNFSFTGSNDLVSGDSSDNNVGALNNAAPGDIVNLAAGNDALTLYAGNNTLSVQNTETINGNTGNDIVTIATAISGGVIDLAGGSGDKVTLSSSAGNSLTVSNVEELQGSGGADNISISQANLSGNSLEGNGGVDTLTITDGGTLTAANLSNVTEFETLVLAADADYNVTLDPSIVGTLEGSITINGTALTSSGSSLTLDGSGETNASIIINSGAGNDVLTGGDKGDTIDGGAGADSLIGGGGNDTLTGGDGADTLTGGGNKDVFNYTATSQFGDTITDFNTGNGGDSIDFDASFVSSLVGTGYTEVNSNGSVSATEGFVVIKTSLSSSGDQQVAGTVATELNMLSGLAANDARIFVIGDGSNARAWSWQDSGDGVVDSGELSSVADLTGVDNLNQFAEANFSDAA